MTYDWTMLDESRVTPDVHTILELANQSDIGRTQVSHAGFASKSALDLNVAYICAKLAAEASSRTLA